MYMVISNLPGGLNNSYTISFMRLCAENNTMSKFTDFLDTSTLARSRGVVLFTS